jgi:hypothetical protein
MTSVERGIVRWAAYYPERLSMTQLGHLTRSMFECYKFVSDGELSRAQ